MKAHKIPFTLDHLNLSGSTYEGMAEVIADFAIESFLEDGDVSEVFQVLVDAHTKLLTTYMGEEGVEDIEKEFLDTKQACEYGAGLVYEFTDSYVIAYLNRMRATMNQLRRMKV